MPQKKDSKKKFPITKKGLASKVKAGPKKPLPNAKAKPAPKKPIPPAKPVLKQPTFQRVAFDTSKGIKFASVESCLRDLTQFLARILKVEDAAKIAIKGSCNLTEEGYHNFRVERLDVLTSNDSDTEGVGYALDRRDAEAIGILAACDDVIENRNYDLDRQVAKERLQYLLKMSSLQAMSALLVRVTMLHDTNPTTTLQTLYRTPGNPPSNIPFGKMIQNVTREVPERQKWLNDWHTADLARAAQDAKDMEQTLLRMCHGVKRFFMHVHDRFNDKATSPTLDDALYALNKGENPEPDNAEFNTESIREDIHALVKRWGAGMPLDAFVTAADWVSQQESESLMDAAAQDRVTILSTTPADPKDYLPPEAVKQIEHDKE